MTMLRIFSDEHGMARITDLDPALRQVADGLGRSATVAVSSASIFIAPPGGGHGEQPEARRQLAVVLAGSCTVTASGETRTCRPGDLLLVEDTAGVGHSSTTDEGFTALMVTLAEGADW
ncbi:cupin domain-containing protein [Actinoplanes sp. GCM10030250]|uniref:cupin domain-containing protein n=1 Tax=Actinoplanes sp. GCM10030250 TaxID=3273376 RepID=UPI003608F53A